MGKPGFPTPLPAGMAAETIIQRWYNGAVNESGGIYDDRQWRRCG